MLRGAAVILVRWMLTNLTASEAANRLLPPPPPPPPPLPPSPLLPRPPPLPPPKFPEGLHTEEGYSYLDLIHDRPSVLQTTVTLTATRCHPELRAGAPTLSLQHPLVSYSQHVILSSLFAISMAVCKGALGGIIIDVSGGAASAKKSKYLDLKTVCCANHAHPHCLSLSGEQVPALHG
ncbi:uncharacterized protein [Manis javanica]|uniref:uncharacterized protein isoform X4 n=1 Tax=Manis javanica TaxID=9974 RepID=UPI003C6DB152